ncbi:MAG: pyridoxamine 5'-phosphate oxidase family protein [Bacteroidetes bacterium]|nr:pyridoxamine 5'-phosphate oxidase family protein [Bacteroidota bacterium]
METPILKYLEENSMFTLATSTQNIPHCAICFYVYDEDNNTLIFKSKEVTRHVQEAIKNKMVAGSITSAYNNITKIKGIQFSGTFKLPLNQEQIRMQNLYNLKFPVSKLFPGTIYAVALDYIKMTDNTLGMGKKRIWEKSETSNKELVENH